MRRFSQAYANRLTASRSLAAFTAPLTRPVPSSRSFLPTSRYFSEAAAAGDAVEEPTGKKIGRPSIMEAQEIIRHPSEMSNELLIQLAYSGDFAACEERLIREIMAVDYLSWEDASEVMLKMKDDNQSGMLMIRTPYKIGLFTSIFAGAVSLPMVFSLKTAIWFNEDYVTTDVPEPRDLETFLEVGSWTWNWMEPPLGTISFVLLCLQFARNQMSNLGWQPYTGRAQQARAARLCAKYPNYCPVIVSRFAIGHAWPSAL